MTLSARSTPQGLPFPAAEYRQRRAALYAELEARDIDLLYVTSPANLLYLTGYEAIWYPSRLPVGALIDRRHDDIVVCDWARHDGYVEARVLHDQSLFFHYGEATPILSAEILRRARRGQVVAVEWSSPTPAAPIMRELADALTHGGLRVTSGDWIVDNLRLYKSDAEIEAVRAAADMADQAMRRLQTSLRPGMSEIEVSALLGLYLAEAGSEPAAMPALVNSGPTAWMDVHAFPSSRRLQAGDVVNVDACASVKRYHANLGRSFVLGESKTKARAIIAAAAGALDALCQKGGRDSDPAPACAAAEAYIRERVAPEHIWWIGGYALGISLLPNWVGHTYLANDGPHKCALRPGYVSNFENVFIDREEGFEAGCIDTLIMTERGLECLSRLPRQLLDVEI